MPIQFNAMVLLEKPWTIDIDLLAEKVSEDFPGIGVVEAMPGLGGEGEAGLLTIDGGMVVIDFIDQPMPAEKLAPPLMTMQSWASDTAVRAHTAHLSISCGGDLEGLQGAKAFAAATHFVTSTLAGLAPATAVFWPESWCLSEPETFQASSQRLLQATMPISAWLTFAAVVPKGANPETALGMVSYGMRPFIGRELELAPAPVNAETALRRIASIARSALDHGLELSDGLRIEGVDGEIGITARERTFWLRREQSAYVLVADDAIVDSEALKPMSA